MKFYAHMAFINKPSNELGWELKANENFMYAILINGIICLS